MELSKCDFWSAIFDQIKRTTEQFFGENSSHLFNKTIKDTVFTRKSAYAQKSAPLELAPPFEILKLNESLPRISAPLCPL